IKPSMIKENLVFFIDAEIVNPQFDSQTKENLITKPGDFKFKYTCPKEFLDKVVKTGVVDSIIQNAESKESNALARIGKSGAKIRDYVKLADAHDASKKQGDCILILTEGDSAKGLILNGLNKVPGKRQK